MGTLLLLLPVISSSTSLASDHADPIDVFNRTALEPGITDLFVFPVTQTGEVAFPFDPGGVSLAHPEIEKRPALSQEERDSIDALIVVLCVRRQLTQSRSLDLEPYSYRVNMDLHSTVSYDDAEADQTVPNAAIGYQPESADPAPSRPRAQEARARYGGLIQRPEKIHADVVIEFLLRNDATLATEPKISGLRDRHLIAADHIWSGISDDPFIFPAFFGTNVVAMVVRIPMRCFPDNQQDWIVWATSHEGDRQIDHVGRSLRTQNPRFELLNTLPPSQHVSVLREEHNHPGLLRELALRFNMQSLFAYREWDFVPDVMIYTNRFPAGFPNGRLLTDDVAARLAQHGDTLLLELSHHNAQWPRRSENDKPFNATFPYLAEPWPDREPPLPRSLSARNKVKLVGILAGLFTAFIVENWLVAALYCRWRMRRRYL